MADPVEQLGNCDIADEQERMGCDLVESTDRTSKARHETQSHHAESQEQVCTLGHPRCEDRVFRMFRLGVVPEQGHFQGNQQRRAAEVVDCQAAQQDEGQDDEEVPPVVPPVGGWGGVGYKRCSWHGVFSGQFFTIKNQF